MVIIHAGTVPNVYDNGDPINRNLSTYCIILWLYTSQEAFRVHIWKWWPNNRQKQFCYTQDIGDATGRIILHVWYHGEFTGRISWHVWYDGDPIDKNRSICIMVLEKSSHIIHPECHTIYLAPHYSKNETPTEAWTVALSESVGECHSAVIDNIHRVSQKNSLSDLL